MSGLVCPTTLVIGGRVTCSVGRAPEWHSGCQGFDSPRLHHDSPRLHQRKTNKTLPGNRTGADQRGPTADQRGPTLATVAMLEAKSPKVSLSAPPPRSMEAATAAAPRVMVSLPVPPVMVSTAAGLWPADHPARRAGDGTRAIPISGYPPPLSPGKNRILLLPRIGLSPGRV